MGHSKYMFNFIRNYLIVFHNEHHFTCPPKMLKFQLLHMLVNTWCCPSFQRKLLWLMTCSASFHVRVNICITYFSKVFFQLFPFLQKVYWLSNVELTLKSWICPPWTWCSILKKYRLVCLADILLGLLAFKFMKNICHGFTAVHFVWCWPTPETRPQPSPWGFCYWLAISTDTGPTKSMSPMSMQMGRQKGKCVWDESQSAEGGVGVCGCLGGTTPKVTVMEFLSSTWVILSSCHS